MIKNYLKVAFRNLWRYKGFSFLNIASLAIGVTGCLVIALFVWDEMQYDKFIKGGENVYRVYNKRTDKQGTTNVSPVPPAYASYLQKNYPEVENTFRIMMLTKKVLVEAGDVKVFTENWYPAEPAFFNFFPLQFIKGEATTGLTDPLSVVITEDFAKTLFGTQDPLGKVIKINKSELTVKGVLANLPSHFHLNFKFLMPLAALKLPEERMQNWGWNQFFTYIKVKPGTNIEQLQNKFNAVVQKQAALETERSEDKYEPQFQQLKNVHLQSADFQYDIAKRGNQTYVKALIIIALFVLVIACFNFINLATARSFRRAKEIGVRKVVGADRKQLLFQFTGESVLLSIISFIIATGATVLLLPALNNFTDKSISFNPVTNPLLALLLIGGAIVIGLLAGIYPALVLSGFKAIKVIKGMKPGGDSASSSWLRQGLVVVQFALSALLIVCTTIVYNQINYLHEKDLGFNKDQVIFFPLRNAIKKKLEPFKAELKRSPNIVSMTVGYGLPGDIYAGDGITLPGKDGEKFMSTTLFMGDENYVRTLGLRLIAGRDFLKDQATDVDEAFIINETAVKDFGFGTPRNAIGQKMNWKKWEPDSLHPIKQGRVIGVVEDFHYTSLHEKVGPLVLQQYPEVKDGIAIKIKAADIKNTIDFITSTWNTFSPDFPLEYKFLDESFNQMYKSEDKLKTLLSIFTIMAIFVGCLGLFGLAAFTAEQRTKEIGIRKVLGATAMNIAAMLSKTFLKPVFIASIIAFPVAWWAMNKWLEDFAYRVSIHWSVFIIGALVALIIALITVSFQAIKAAVSNPVKSLRTE